MKIALLMKRRWTRIVKNVMLMRSGLGPTETRSREFLSIKLQGAARPACTSRRWRLSFPLFCAVLVMTRSSRGPEHLTVGFAYTAARASASWRTRAGARPTRPSFSRVFRPHRNVVGSRRICCCESTSSKQAYVDLSVSVLPATAIKGRLVVTDRFFRSVPVR